jgi:hypothetical protein
MQKRPLQVTLDRSSCGLHSRLQPSKFSQLLHEYHQIPLKVEDQIRMSFIILFGAFCYTAMSFGLKSAVQLTSGVYNGVYIHRLGAA